MTNTSGVNCANARRTGAIALLLISQAAASATDWPQYRGPTTDGISPDRILATWPASPIVGWRNGSATNGFSSVAVSQGRAFAMSLRTNFSGGWTEYCVALNAANGTNLWATPIDAAPSNWDPHGTDYGGAGPNPYNTGDGTRTTPSVKDGRVFAFSGSLRLVCLNATNGSIIWNNDLQSSYGGTPPLQYDNCASPCLDDDLLFVNINTATNDETLLALRASDGDKAWSSQNENSTHATPIVTTIQGVRQVIFATTSGLVSLDRSTGSFLWKFTYPFSPISTSMGASPVFYSNIVYCTTAYGRGAAAARVTFTNSAWTVSQLYYMHEGPNPPLYYSSIWMTPVCFQGYIYSLAGNNGGTFLTAPLSCIELSTGTKMWSTSNFGMGGLILVNTNILALNETGQLVLIKPNPSAYTELARFQAFQFDDSSHGKCWNSPSFSDGHIYARSTREVINVDVSPPATLPGLATGGASNLTATAATLYGTANPNGATTGAWFQWGLTTSYGSNTPAILNLGGTAPLNVSNSLSGLIPGTTYHFRIAGTNSAGTTNGADATFAALQPPPVISTQPRSRAAVVGSNPSFSVVATNLPANAYQWRFFATNVLAGGTNATLIITNAQATNFGDYTVRITNSGGAVTSTVASLTRAVAPSISSNRIALGALFLTFTTEYGPTYFVDYKNNLQTQAWTPLTSGAGIGSPITITDNGITNATRFYRIRLQ